MEKELTPSAAEATLEVVSSEPADISLPTGDVTFDAEGNPLASEAMPPEEEAAGSATLDAEPATEDVQAELARLRQERADIEAMLAQRAQAEAQAQAEQYWNSYETDLDTWLQQASAVVYQNAQNAYDQAAYIAKEMGKVQQQYAEGQRQLRTAREAAIWGTVQQQQVPVVAAQLAQKYGLPQEAAADLMHLPSGLMEKEAQRLSKVYETIQQLYRENDQLKRSRAAASVGGVAPGGGRAAGGRIKAGSRQHLMALWGQGR